MSTNLAQLGLSPTALDRSLGMPREGPKCIPINLDFTTKPSYYLDYQNLQARGFVSMIQCIFVDNSANASSLTVFSNKVNQSIVVPANKQGYFTLLVPNPPLITFLTAGTVVVPIILLNFPVPGVVW